MTTTLIVLAVILLLGAGWGIYGVHEAVSTFKGWME